MNSLARTLIGAAAVGAVAITSASPGFAQRGRDRDRDDGISTGEVIAGALILGGIAAVIAASDDDDDRYDDRRYDSRVYGAGRSRAAVEQCVSATERRASRRSYGGRAEVTDVRSIKRSRQGYTVKGRVAVNTRGRGWRQGDRQYGRGWGNDYRGWNDSYRGWDAGNFTCRVRYGEVSRVSISGIRGLS
jgi:hypothetical protein